ncbi:16S rRNA (cytosine(967)-C(5))-methyltransferase RsmB [Thiospirillum jenense]|uniref:16S rRNA (cytosine(967)-C(5))-methyltransferase n=1 Tax=Thiospirillum jenense TaxID=1653858 RepID=A0A839HGH7_9GAMM|nr:16S rRNA (cytosine(967)-C(5))-methyltransferase RsmB [Thiospirillum jenense]MBB1125412.1 16S rRNA (cytosine(967)-C(5))-methyltransferase RsmB [Thiospirillum jenense]
MTELGAVTRARAAQIVAQVRTGGHSLTAALLEMQPTTAALDARDWGFVQELTYGTLRYLPRLEVILRQLVARPLKATDQDLAALLLVGLYQLDRLQLPAHAAVGATVAAARVLDKPWATGLVNGSLRRFQRDSTALLAQVTRTDDRAALQWSFPTWLLNRLQTAWPDDWQAIVTASNTRAPLFLRTNPLRQTRAAYLAELTAAGIDAEPLPDQPTGLRVLESVAASRLPGYSDGRVSVQDAGAQQVAALLDCQPGQLVLDACAAPGGKAAHLQELAANQLHLTALEQAPARLVTLREEFARLGLTADMHCADASQPGDQIWATRRYDRILLDAPCSGTGVIRRHPDIKCLRRDRDITAVVAQQARLLDALWPLLTDDGILLYVTCSLLPDENDHQIAAFLTRHADADLAPISADWGVTTAHGRYLLPTAAGSDGFFYARLQRQRSP